jgi:beta-galactosidase
MKNLGPISPKLPRIWHGGDYNPDQWLHDPRVLSEDLRMMKLAGCNAMTLAVFAWAALEPSEGKYELDWLAEIMDRLYANGIFTVLSTPSGARPAWMAEKYPEVLRVGPDMRRNLFGGRHNHCISSPVYREKAAALNARMAERFARHPGMLLWHLSNELSGECHCDLCQEGFRAWLQKKYHNDLSALNRTWWTAFWSHTFSDWSQIRSPSPLGECGIHGQNLDWRRYVTDQTVDFMKWEIAALRRVAPELPVTTNLMGTYGGLDYWKLVPHLDAVSWDSYPCWHGVGPLTHPWASWDPEGRDWRLAADYGFIHDLMRSLKGGKPFLLMESVPSATSWPPASKLKRPGMHMASSLQAVAHGADTVQYFQWRKGRGGPEKFHGAVVDHAGHEHTRVFSDVAKLGEALSKLDGVVGTTVPSEAAILFDWENRWALEDAQGPLNDGRKHYERTCKDHYYPFWSMGIAVDVINEDSDFSPYRLIVAPMLYMVRSGVAERLEAFVERGGTLVGTYWSGIADENDLCFLGGFPGPLRRLFGVWAEEIDALYPAERNAITMEPANLLGLRGSYEARDLCELVHLEGAQVLAHYERDFYAGMPALAVNRFGKGAAYYMASRCNDSFLDSFYDLLTRALGISRALPERPPEGVSARVRRDERNLFLFLINFKPTDQRVSLGVGKWTDVLSGADSSPVIPLGPYGVAVLRKS